MNGKWVYIIMYELYYGNLFIYVQRLRFRITLYYVYVFSIY